MSDSQRPEVVDALANAARDGMVRAMKEQGIDFSAAEALSGCFTLTQRMIETVMRLYPGTGEGISKTLQLILLQVATSDPKAATLN